MSAINKISKKLPAVADHLSSKLRKIAGQPVAFSLIVWTEGRFQYVSNSKDRAEIKTALQALIDGWDEGMPDIPAHKVN